jgi:hypothetical protein
MGSGARLEYAAGAGDAFRARIKTLEIRTLFENSSKGGANERRKAERALIIAGSRGTPFGRRAARRPKPLFSIDGRIAACGHYRTGRADNELARTFGLVSATSAQSAIGAPGWSQSYRRADCSRHRSRDRLRMRNDRIAPVRA